MNKNRVVASIYLLGSTGITVVSIYDPLIVHYIYPWARISVPVCLFVGLLGSILSIRGVIAASKIIGWVGLTVFSLIAIRVVIPDEMVRSTGDPPPANIFVIVPRMILILGLLTLTALAFRRLYRREIVESRGRNGSGRPDAS
jgi:hypothetical protein